ncbi:Methylthioribose-1-phosphate isomerase [BD1-7 clade bacterium]|uniref:Methylthioribose-1-phosphate isomerase n=1 Tax=BD1-7 clade bacterium TaxID=2029982 RepID=A0A5S9QZ80_9GAMM|nr:Methylthioribose-1-phosphate isomerase [BD1-7 clade bacterium]
MLLDGIKTRTVFFDENRSCVRMLDQTRLPFAIEWLDLKSPMDVVTAIASMQVRGAPAIGAVAAYGMALACEQSDSIESLKQTAETLKAARPTAVNLAWAVDRQLGVLERAPVAQWQALALAEANAICDEDVAACETIGEFGADLIAAIAQRKNGQTVNILTHCNAGWLATVDWGTALAPIYKAAERGIDVHVWVDETRPRNQGASLTALELSEQGIAHTLIADNSGGHLMQHGKVDCCIVGTDRTSANGDVCNKIGTYLKALAAHDNHVPFYVALPTSTIDFSIQSGFDTPIEERSEDEVLYVNGLTDEGDIARVRIAPSSTPAANPAFDVTPARLVSGLITEKGVVDATRTALTGLQNQYHRVDQ